MNWFSMTLHVFKKDLTLLKWPLVGYGALVGTVALLTTMWLTDWPLMAAWSAGIVFVGMALMAPPVIDDSPTSDNALWRSRPVRASSVFASKLLVALTVMLIALVGQGVALASFAPTTPQLLTLMGASGRLLAIWLLWSLIVATQSRDFRAFVALSLSAPVVVLFAMSIITFVRSHVWFFPPLNVTPTVLLVIMAAGLALLTFMYLKRSSRVLQVGGALLVMMGLFQSQTNVRRRVAQEPPTLANPTTVVSIKRFQVLSPKPDQRSVEVSIQLDGAAPTHRVVLINPLVAVQFANGERISSRLYQRNSRSTVVQALALGAGTASSSIAIDDSATSVTGFSGNFNSHVVMANPTRVPGFEIAWPDDDWIAGAIQIANFYKISATHQAAFDSGNVQIFLEGNVLETEPTVHVAINNKLDERAAVKGIRMARTEYRDEAGHLREQLEIRALPDVDSFIGYRMQADPLGQAVVFLNTATGASRSLDSHTSYMGSEGLVVPGASATILKYDLKTLSFLLGDRGANDSSLLQGGMFAVIGWKNPRQFKFKTAAVLLRPAP